MRYKIVCYINYLVPTVQALLSLGLEGVVCYMSENINLIIIYLTLNKSFYIAKYLI